MSPVASIRSPLPSVWTIGHSTRLWDEFLGLLEIHGIQAIADVRRFPGSRRHPWFASDAMAEALPAIGVDYLWIPELGGRRRVQPNSPNGAWDNAAFQGYADHMASKEFEEGLDKALRLVRGTRTALMCAEAPWWRCHRRLISDLLTHRDYPVLHILGSGAAQPHPLNAMARPKGRNLVYPAPQADLFSGMDD